MYDIINTNTLTMDAQSNNLCEKNCIKNFKSLHLCHFFNLMCP